MSAHRRDDAGTRARDTLSCSRPGKPSCSGAAPSGRWRSSFTQVGYGNTAQAGLVNVAALNGSFDNILSLGSGNII